MVILCLIFNMIFLAGIIVGALLQYNGITKFGNSFYVIAISNLTESLLSRLWFVLTNGKKKKPDVIGRMKLMAGLTRGIPEICRTFGNCWTTNDLPGLSGFFSSQFDGFRRNWLRFQNAIPCHYLNFHLFPAVVCGRLKHQAVSLQDCGQGSRRSLRRKRRYYPSSVISYQSGPDELSIRFASGPGRESGCLQRQAIVLYSDHLLQCRNQEDATRDGR